MAKISYVSETAPNLELRISDSPEIVVKFVNKQAFFDDENEEDLETIKIMDRLIETRPNVAQLVRKLDYRKAEATARRIREEMANDIQQQSGGVTAQGLGMIKYKQHSENMRVQMLAEGATEEQIENALRELAEASGVDGGFIIPVKVEGSRGVDTPNDGVTIDEKALAVQQALNVQNTKTDGPKPKFGIFKPATAAPPIAGNTPPEPGTDVK